MMVHLYLASLLMCMEMINTPKQYGQSTDCNAVSCPNSIALGQQITT